MAHETAPTVTDPGGAKHKAGVEMPQTGDLVGRYTVLAELGAGAMGAVFLASDPELNRRVAIKLMSMRGGHDYRLLDEARALAKLQHPNVVAIHDVGRWQGQVYIAMEHVAGVSLDKWLEKHRDWRERLAVFRQAGLGLAAAHAANIVHHDVKPSNIMVGDDGRVRLVDFGLARAAEREHAVGSAAGTPRYMSPEQRRGEVADARTDQFSLCVSLYEALFDTYPFEGASFEARDESVLAGRVRMPSGGKVPARVRDAIVRGLQPGRDDRHASTEALLAELELPAPARRGRWIATIAAAALVAGVGTAAIVRTRARGAPRGKWAAILDGSRLVPELPTPLPGDPLGVTVHRLSNGLTVYISPDHDTPRVHALLRFHAGNAQAPGIAMIAMRMSRRGTSTISTVDYAKEKPLLDQIEKLYAERAKTTDPAARAKLDDAIDKASVEASRYAIADEHTQLMQGFGVHYNYADMNRQQCSFEEDIASNWFPMWADLTADRFSDPVFRAFRSTVVEVMGYPTDSTFFFGPVLDAVTPRLYRGHPLGFTREELLKAQAREPLSEVEAYFHTYFIPNNADLILSGDVDPVTTIPVLEKAFARWEPKPAPPPLPPAPAPVAETLELKTAGNRAVSFHWLIPVEVESDPAAALLPRLLASARQDAKAVGIAALEYGTVDVTVDANPGESLDDTEKRLAAQVDVVRNGTFSDETLEALVHDMRARDQLGVLDLRSRVWSIAGTAWRLKSLPWSDELKARSSAITRASVMRVAHAIFDRPHITVRAEAGKMDPPPNIPPPKPPLVAFQVGHSKAGAALLARDKVELQPKPMVAGKDYEERQTPAGWLVAKRDPNLHVFVLQTRYEVGDGTLPLVCSSIKARLRTMVPQSRQHGIDIDLECNHRWISLILRGVDEDLPAATAVMKGAFSDPTPEEWATWQHIVEPSAAALAGRLDWVNTAIEQYGLFGPSAPFLADIDVQAIRAGTAERAAADATRLRAAPRFISYVGPRASDDVVAMMPTRETKLPAPEQGSSPMPPATTRKVVLLDTGPVTPGVNVSVMYPVADLFAEKQEALFELYSQYWSADVNVRSTSAGNESFQTHSVYAFSKDDPGYIAMRIKTTAADAARRASKAISTLFDEKFDADRFNAAKIEREEAVRSDWVKRSEIGTRIVNDRAHGVPAGVDPRVGLNTYADTLSVEDLDRATDQLRHAPRIITVWGNLQGIDKKAFEQLGEVTSLTVPELIDAHWKATTGAVPAAAPTTPAAPAPKASKSSKSAKASKSSKSKRKARSR